MKNCPFCGARRKAAKMRQHYIVCPAMNQMRRMAAERKESKTAVIEAVFGKEGIGPHALAELVRSGAVQAPSHWGWTTKELFNR